MADVARRQQGEFDLEAMMANVEAQLGQQVGLSNLYGNIYGSLLGGIGGLLSGSDRETGVPWIIDKLF
jgi:hypothetical protein